MAIALVLAIPYVEQRLLHYLCTFKGMTPYAGTHSSISYSGYIGVELLSSRGVTEY